VRLPGPPELLPGRPDAVIDLQSVEGLELVQGRWRYRASGVTEVTQKQVGPDLGPTGASARTLDLALHAGSADHDDSDWAQLDPAETTARLGTGRTSFVWYRLGLTVPEQVGDLDPTGATLVFECVLDDYAEVWVDGELPLWLGRSGGAVVSGFNAPNRVVLTDDARPGQRFQLAVLGINAPLSNPPANFVWIRSAAIDVFAAGRGEVSERVDLAIEPAMGGKAARLAEVVGCRPVADRVATGFEFTEGPVWRDGGLLFSSPNTNAVYRWSPPGTVDVVRVKSGYTGPDIGRYHQPGSNGLAFDPQGRLTLCEHGNRLVRRVEPRGNTTILADSWRGRRLNSPNDLVYACDGTLYFTDPWFGLPDGADDPKRELPFSGVFGLRDGELWLIDDALSGPNGIATSPDDRYLYVGNWDISQSVVIRYPVLPDGRTGPGEVLADLTDQNAPDSIDGLAVDDAGNLLVCGPHGIWALAPDGEPLGLLQLPESPHNLAWGPDRSTLFVTAETSIYRLTLDRDPDRPGSDERTAR
jgi:gluconolactonase